MSTNRQRFISKLPAPRSPQPDWLGMIKFTAGCIGVALITFALLMSILSGG